MKKLENLSKKELKDVKKMVGEAYLMNELFHEFGTMQEREKLVKKYTSIIVDSAYKAKVLYGSDDRKAFIGVAYNDEMSKVSQLYMMAKLYVSIPRSVLKRFIKQVQQVSNHHSFTQKPYVDVFMICVASNYQGRGYARQLIAFAKEKAKKRDIPILIDTTMEEYANIYQHYDFELYQVKQADNGVKQYSLIWTQNNH